MTDSRTTGKRWLDRTPDDHDRTGRSDRLERRRHVIAVCVAAATLFITACGWTPSPSSAVVVVLAAVAAGMPHGALDIVMGRRATRPAAFYVTYLAVAISAAVIWVVAPVLGLFAFFAASWFHFARGDAAHHRRLGRASGLSGISTAGCAIGLPLALHSAIVAPLLRDLLRGAAEPTAGLVSDLGWMIAYPSLVAGFVAVAAAITNHDVATTVEIAVIALLAGSVHPLLSFALYFSLWHSPRHLISLDIDRSTWVRTFGAAAAMVAAGAVAWHWTQPSAGTETRLIFIGLAAVTWPHLAVTEMVRRPTSAHLAGRATSLAVPDIA